MNARLLGYLRSLGLSATADDSAAWDYFKGLRGIQANIANALNYTEADQQARTNCDLMIRALGYDPSNPANLLAPEPTQTNQPGSDGASAKGDLERARAEGIEQERERVKTIRELAAIAGSSGDFTQPMIDDPKVTVDVAREKIFKDHQARTTAQIPTDLPGGPAIHSRNSVTGLTVEILEAAVLHRSGIDPTKNWVRDEDNTPTRRRPGVELEKAADLAWQYRRMSMADVIRACARIDNVTLPAGNEGLLQAYLRSFSTAALTAVYTTNINSRLLSTFETAPDSTTGGWVRETDVNDFRTNERVRLTNGGALAKLPRGSTADHMSYSDSVESYKIARYAAQFVIDDQDVIDNNFGTTQSFVPEDMGVAARQLRPDIVYSILMANAAMRDSVALFHATHANLNTGSALTIPTIQTATTNMSLQRENGRNLNLRPNFLIVPPALFYDARVATNSAGVVVAGDTDIVRGQLNALQQDGVVVVTDARLQNGVINPVNNTLIAGSATTWFMAAMAGAHTIEVGYLAGTGRVPQVRSFVLTEGKWGLGWDIKMDIGGKALAWEGLSKNTA